MADDRTRWYLAPKNDVDTNSILSQGVPIEDELHGVTCADGEVRNLLEVRFGKARGWSNPKTKKDLKLRFNVLRKEPGDSSPRPVPFDDLFVNKGTVRRSKKFKDMAKKTEEVLAGKAHRQSIRG